MNAPFPNPPPPATRQPFFNLPIVVTALVGVLFAIHAVRVFLLGQQADLQLVLALGFIPGRETAPDALNGIAPAGIATQVATFLTYAFLHGDWVHVSVNSLWLAAFGSPLARRLGWARFLLFSAVGAIAGAALHLGLFPHSFTPVIGASAAISAMMAGAARFVFQGGGQMWGNRRLDLYHRPAPPLGVVIRDQRVIVFVVVWFAANILFGMTGGAGLASGAIAWDAHIGGFIVGLLMFPLFDPVPAES